MLKEATAPHPYNLTRLREAHAGVSPRFRGRELSFEFTSKESGKGEPFLNKIVVLTLSARYTEIKP